MTAPFLFFLRMSLSKELVVRFHEEIKGVVSSILCCMIIRVFWVVLCNYCWRSLVDLGKRMFNVGDG